MVRTQIGRCARDGDLMLDTDKGAIRATNVYIVVFRDGICSVRWPRLNSLSPSYAVNCLSSILRIFLFIPNACATKYYN